MARWFAFAGALAGGLYLFMILALAIHEILGHGLAAILCGGRFTQFSLKPGFTGYAWYEGVDRSRWWVVTAAGNVVNLLVGLPALALARRRLSALAFVGWLLATTNLGLALGYTFQGLLFAKGDAGELARDLRGPARLLAIGVAATLLVAFAAFALRRLVLYLAAFLTRRQESIARFTEGLLPVLLVAGGMATLTLLQPDLGNSLALIILTLALAYLAGARVQHMALIAGAALPVVIALIAMKPYRWRRMVAFMDPWDDPQGIGFQIIQSFLALGSGGWLGVGLGDSKQKLFYLPEPYTDFIFSIIGEELGLVGTSAILGLFALLMWRGLRVGLRAPDAFGAYLALGLTVMLATQTLVNIGVVTGALPTKGLPLPFISFGGSALLMTMFSAGVLLNISQHGTGDRELYSRKSA